MWTCKNLAPYDRSKLRYPSDLTDEEWGLVEPLIPPGKTGGGKRTVIMREVVNGLMYILSTGCQWRAIPKDLPPKGSVHGYFDRWTYDGTLERIHDALDEQCRERAQRKASPTAAIRSGQQLCVLPKRWIVERTIVWPNRCRRLAKDWECLNRKALAFLRLASIRLVLKKLCNPA
jgi:transposase